MEFSNACHIGTDGRSETGVSIELAEVEYRVASGYPDVFRRVLFERVLPLDLEAEPVRVELFGPFPR